MNPTLFEVIGKVSATYFDLPERHESDSSLDQPDASARDGVPLADGPACSPFEVASDTGDQAQLPIAEASQEPSRIWQRLALWLHARGW